MTGIEWTDATWNPVTGCSKVSPGCAHCYAETLALTRLTGKPGYPGLPWTPENAAENVVLRPERLDLPLHWRKPRRVFVNSMSDLFHEQVPDEFIGKVFGTMSVATRHTFQVLTKRPGRMRDWLRAVAYCEHGWLTHNGDNPRSYRTTLSEYDGPGTGQIIDDGRREFVPTGEVDAVGRRIVALTGEARWPLPHVWLGTSIENDRFVGRADALRETPAAVRFLSLEPLLGPLPSLDLTGIEWVIVGGESGPAHRPMDPAWARDLRDRCVSAGVAFFFKQWGGRTPKANGRTLDGRTWDEYPALRAWRRGER
jgi:protein gp37